MTKEEIVYELLEQYNKECYPTPKIDDIKFVHDNNSWGELDISNLYNHKYVLELYPGMFMLNKYFVNQIMYHEFTHIYDSTKFQHLDLASFNDIMQIYSEIHSSEIENRELILTQNAPYSLDKVVVGMKGNKTLKEYIDRAIGELCEQFMPSGELITPETDVYDYRELYSVLGKLRALNYFNIDYDYSLINIITNPFLNIINEIIKYGLNLNIEDAKIFMELQDKLIDSINSEKEHNNKIYKLLNE